MTSTDNPTTTPSAIYESGTIAVIAGKRYHLHPGEGDPEEGAFVYVAYTDAEWNAYVAADLLLVQRASDGAWFLHREGVPFGSVALWHISNAVRPTFNA